MYDPVAQEELVSNAVLSERNIFGPDGRVQRRQSERTVEHRRERMPRWPLARTAHVQPATKRDESVLLLQQRAKLRR